MVCIILPDQNASDYTLPSGVTIYCTKYSSVDSWAQQNGYPIIHLDNVLVLPETLLTIEAEAFNTAVEYAAVHNIPRIISK